MDAPDSFISRFWIMYRPLIQRHFQRYPPYVQIMASLFPAFSIRQVLKQVLQPRLTENQAVGSKLCPAEANLTYWRLSSKNLGLISPIRQNVMDCT